MASGSKAGPPLAKAETISDSGGTPGVMVSWFQPRTGFIVSNSWEVTWLREHGQTLILFNTISLHCQGWVKRFSPFQEEEHPFPGGRKCSGEAGQHLLPASHVNNFFASYLLLGNIFVVTVCPLISLLFPVNSSYFKLRFSSFLQFWTPSYQSRKEEGKGEQVVVWFHQDY